MEDEESLECPVCMEPYDKGKRTPQLMTCSHTTCITCVIDLARGVPKTRGQGQVSGSAKLALPKGKTFKCPMCRESIATNKMKTNRYVLAHLKDLRRLQGLKKITPKKPIERKTTPHQATTAHIIQPIMIINCTSSSTISEILTSGIDQCNISRRQRRKAERRDRKMKPKNQIAHGQPDIITVPDEPTQLGGQCLRQSIPSPRDQLHQISQEEHPQSHLHGRKDPYHEPQPADNQYYTLVNIRKNRTPSPPTGPITTTATKTIEKTPPEFILCRPSTVHDTTAVATPVAAAHVKGYQRNPSHEPSRGINISQVLVPSSDAVKTKTTLPSRSAPPNQTDLRDKWCRTCEEPAKAICTKHNPVLLLNEEQLCCIQQELKPMLDKLQHCMRDDDLSAAMSRASLNTSPASFGVNNAASRQGVDNSEVQSTPDLNKLTYPEIRDKINTSCDPDFVLNYYKELCRRRLEYLRTIKTKKMKRVMPLRK